MVAASILRALVVSACVVASLLAAAPAEAQSSAAAQALFDQAVALRSSGDIAKACPKFEESLRLEPAVGTRFNLADCFERQGRLASAWSQFLQVAADTERAGDRDRAEASRGRAKKLEPRLAKMVIVPKGASAGLVVERDGVAVGQAQWSTALPVDPGPHLVAASAPGKRSWQQTVNVGGEGQLVTVNIPILDDAPAGEMQHSPLPTPGFPAEPRREPSATPMIAGLTVGALGLVGLGIGTALGVVAINKKGEVDERCPNLDACTVEGIAINDEAKTAATASTVAFIAGGALLATGIVLWIALPSEVPATVGVRVSPGGAWLSGQF